MRLNAAGTQSYIWMNILNGIAGDHTAHSCSNGCSCKLLNLVEKGREVSMPWVQTWSPQARPRDRCLCHQAGRILDHLGGDWRAFPPDVFP